MGASLLARALAKKTKNTLGALLLLPFIIIIIIIAVLAPLWQ